MRKELFAGFIAFVVLSYMGYLVEFHPLCFVLLSMFCAALLVGQIPLEIIRQSFARKNFRISQLVKRLGEVGLKVLELRKENQALYQILKLKSDQNTDYKIVLEELIPMYNDLLAELKELQPDKKRGLFSKQKLFNVKAKYAQEEEKEV